jgi:hypothetical protein
MRLGCRQRQADPIEARTSSASARQVRVPEVGWQAKMGGWAADHIQGLLA